MRSALLWGTPTTPTSQGRSQAVAARSTGTAAVRIDTTTAPVTPFNVFLNTRGGQFTTPGTGLSQAPPSGGPQGGLAGALRQSDLRHHLQHLQPLAPVHSGRQQHHRRVVLHTRHEWGCPATVSGFGAVFTDVDQPDGSGPGQKHGNRGASTLIEYFGVDGELLFSSFVPASPGDGSLSFFGIVFDDARIARVRITSGNVAPGPDDDAKHDVVMMDDFIYGEPQPLP